MWQSFANDVEQPPATFQEEGQDGLILLQPVF